MKVIFASLHPHLRLRQGRNQPGRHDDDDRDDDVQQTDPFFSKRKPQNLKETTEADDSNNTNRLQAPHSDRNTECGRLGCSAAQSTV